jgi:maleylacetoacetate isomerase
MKLYSYWRSSAAYRVRIALGLKGITCEQVPINLLKAEHKQADYLRINPAGLVPALELDDGRCLSQSTAIIQWLDSEFPQPALLPTDAFARAQIMSAVYTVACEIHPLNNVGVLNYIKSELGADEAQTRDWLFAWFRRGFTSLETQINATPYCFGTDITMADIYLVPMAYNALRFDYDLTGQHPRVAAVYEACGKLPAFDAARPENQPDAVA